MNESHSRAELEKLGVARLRELKKKYEARVAKGDRDAARELADIHGLLRAKGGGHGLDEDIQTPARQREMARKIKGAEHAADAAANRYMRAGEEAHKSADSDPQADKAYRKAGADYEKAAGKESKLVATSRKEKTSKRLYGKGGKVLKRKAVKEAVTPAQKKVFARERERMLTALNDPNKKLSPTEREAAIARGERSAAAEARKGAVSPTGVKGPDHAQAVRYHNYARKESKKLDAILKRKGKAVKESAEQIDERIIDEVDFFQASKNWIKGKGFKTNRDVSGARVNANYAAMKARQAAEAKGKGKGKTK